MNERHTLHPNGFDLLPVEPRLGRILPAADGVWIMNALTILAGLVALALMVYLFLALLKPEWFD